MNKSYAYKFLVFFMCNCSFAFANDVKYTKNLLQQQINQIKVILQKEEAAYILLQQELICNKKLIDKSRQQLMYEQDKFAKMLQALRNFSNYSPYLTALTNYSFQDLVHLYLLIKSLTPTFKTYHKEILDIIICINKLNAQNKKLNTQMGLLAYKCYEHQELLSQLLAKN